MKVREIKRRIRMTQKVKVRFGEPLHLPSSSTL